MSNQDNRSITLTLSKKGVMSKQNKKIYYQPLYFGKEICYQSFDEDFKLFCEFSSLQAVAQNPIVSEIFYRRFSQNQGISGIEESCRASTDHSTSAQLSRFNQQKSKVVKLTNAELERIIDILSCRWSRIPLALDYYQENFRLLKKNIHQEVLSFVLLEGHGIIDLGEKCLLIQDQCIAFFDKTFSLTFRNPRYRKQAFYLIDLFARTILPLFNPQTKNQATEATVYLTIKAKDYLLPIIQANPSSESDEDLYTAYSLFVALHKDTVDFKPYELTCIMQNALRLTLTGNPLMTHTYRVPLVCIQHSLVKAFENKQTRNQVLKEICSNLVPGKKFLKDWEGKFPVYDAGPWQVNLDSRQILFKEKPISFLALNQIQKIYPLVAFLFEDQILDEQELWRCLLVDGFFVNASKTIKITLQINVDTCDYGFEQNIMGQWFVYHHRHLQFTYSWNRQLDQFPSLELKEYQALSFWSCQENENPLGLIRNEKGDILSEMLFLPEKDVIESENTPKTTLKRKHQAISDETDDYEQSALNKFLYCEIKDPATGLFYIDLTSIEIDSFTQTILNPFLNFVSFREMNCWMNKSTQQIERIELIPYKLNFYLDGDRYYCSTYPGFWVVNHDNRPPLPFKYFNSFLHLSHAEGVHFLIIFNAYQFDKGPASDPLVFLNSNHTGDVEARSFLVYPFNPEKGYIQADGIEKKLLLATCFATEENFEQAFSLIRDCKIDEPFSQDQFLLLSDFTSVAQEEKLRHPTKFALEVHIYYLFLEHAEDTFLKEIRLPFSATICESYKNYIASLKAIPVAFHLKPEQERFIIFFLRENFRGDFDSCLIHRKRNLANKRDGSPITFHIDNDSGLFDSFFFFFPDYQFDNLNEDVQAKDNSLPTVPFFEDDFELKKWMVPLFHALFSDDLEQSILAKTLILFYSKHENSHDSFLKIALLNQKKCLDFLTERLGKDFLKNPVEAIQFLTTFMRDQSSQFVHSYEITMKEQIFFQFNQDIQNVKSHLFFNFKLNPTELSLPRQLQNHFSGNHHQVLHQNFEARQRILRQHFQQTMDEDPNYDWKIDEDSPLSAYISHHPTAHSLYQKCLVKLQEPSFQEHFHLLQDAKTFIRELQNHKDQLNQQGKNFIEQAVHLANKTLFDEERTISTKDIQKAVSEKIEIIAGKRETIGERSLAWWVLQNNREELIKHNPHLSARETQNVYALFLKGIAYQIEVQHLTDLLSNAQAIVRSSDHIEAKQLINKLGGGLQIQRLSEGTSEDDRLLAFEYLSELMLWDQQATIIKHALRDGQLNLVFQLMMGKGKTKVILPCLALLFADGERIPFLVVPFSLKNQNLKDLRHECQTKFGLRVFTFTFSRDSDVSEETLEKLKTKSKKFARKKDMGWY